MTGIGESGGAPPAREVLPIEKEEEPQPTPKPRRMLRVFFSVLDRYVLRELLSTTAMTLVVLTGIGILGGTVKLVNSYESFGIGFIRHPLRQQNQRLFRPAPHDGTGDAAARAHDGRAA